MNKFKIILTIIVFILKTGNVFSNNIIFNVNNIVVTGKINNEEDRLDLLDEAFQKGFKEFINKTLLSKDIERLSNIPIKSIKDLIFSYQIESEEISTNNQSIFKINLRFDQNKINRYLTSENIPYADVSEITITLLPILIEGENIYLYSDNYFYTNWIKEEKEKKTELINFNLALENIEHLEYVNKNKDKLESIDEQKLFIDYGKNNYAFIIINLSEKNIKSYIKVNIQNQKVNKNLNFKYDKNNKTNSLNDAIEELKKEINQIWKNQNLIDINTPSFINLTLEINKRKDLLRLKSILEQIDVIENSSVLLLNKDYAKIKVKYLGKVSKIKAKLIEQNIDIKIVNNEWKLSLQ